MVVFMPSRDMQVLLPSCEKHSAAKTEVAKAANGTMMVLKRMAARVCGG